MKQSRTLGSCLIRMKKFYLETLFAWLWYKFFRVRQLVRLEGTSIMYFRWSFSLSLQSKHKKNNRILHRRKTNHRTRSSKNGACYARASNVRFVDLFHDFCCFKMRKCIRKEESLSKWKLNLCNSIRTAYITLNQTTLQFMLSLEILRFNKIICFLSHLFIEPPNP